MDVYVFDTTSKEKKNLTEKVQSSDTVRVYNEPAWSEDDSEIRSDYASFSFSDVGVGTKGVSVIDVLSGEVKDE